MNTMNKTTKNGTTTIGVLALGLLVATLLATLLSTVPADAAVSTGKAYGWGYNEFGQLGNGTSGAGTDTNTPGPVSNLSGVKSAKAGCDHGLALKADGTVRAWGYNQYGQLGNGASGDGTDRNLPVKVQIENVKAISAGCNHNLTLKENGTVWAWGSNSDGQLGNGTHGDGTHKSTPGSVVGLENVRSISGGAYHSLAVLQSGRARAWGYNGYGQLGNGASGAAADTDVPVAIKNLTNVKNVEGGYMHSLATTQ